jgi:succinate dehydrogenase / fumarate reductase flavoprotein subunit
MSTIPGLFVLGEANFSDHGANRLGASALMQGLADGYFVIPLTIGDYLATQPRNATPPTDRAEFQEAEEAVTGRIQRLLAVQGKRNVSEFHRRLGRILWDYCGMSRNREGLRKALKEIPPLREEFWRNVNILGDGNSLNQSLERAARVADFLELGELMCRDALAREESCGCHFREEYEEAGECKRNDEQFAHAAVWEWQGEEREPVRHVEPIEYERVHFTTRSYK